MKGSWDHDRDPLAARREGDDSLFEAFVSQEFRTFVGFFLGLGAEPNEAEDLTQEVFLKLFHTAPTYTPRERFPAFAFRVARNAWIDRRRRRAVRPDRLSLEAPSEAAPEARGLDERVGDGAESSVDTLARREEAERLRSELAELPEHHRLVFELGVVQELGYAEIAGILDIPVGTVKSRMFHAVRRLRGALARAETPANDSKRGEQRA